MRPGNVFIEILVAFAVFAAMLVPLIRSFGTGVKQTQVVKSHATARGLAEWGLSQARALVAAGFYQGLPCGPDGLVAQDQLAPDVRARMPEAAAQLRELSLARTVACVDLGTGSARRIYRIRVVCVWRDPEVPRPRQLELTALEGEEI